MLQSSIYLVPLLDLGGGVVVARNWRVKKALSGTAHGATPSQHRIVHKMHEAASK